MLKTFHTPHGGKLSVARVLRGQVGDGTVLQHARAARPAASPACSSSSARPPRSAGRRRSARPWRSASSITPSTGDTLTAGKQAAAPLAKVAPLPPVLAIAIAAKERKDDVKLGQALHKLIEEDPSVSVVHNPETHEVVVWGQGEMHLRVATERLADRFGVAIATQTADASATARPSRSRSCSAAATRSSPAATASSATSCSTSSRCRAAAGFTFAEEIKGGVVPRNYIPSVEEGVIDALKHGPLGFPVVDVAVKLVDGSYHTVDSSDMAFRTAGRIGISEGLPQCQPVLLEPIYEVEIVCPSDATAKMNAI